MKLNRWMIGAVLAGCAMAGRGQRPAIANLWGIYPAATDYARMARYSLIVTAGGAEADWRRWSGELRRRNPSIRLLNTAPFMNLSAPAKTPWMRDEWWLRKPDGSKVNWWADQVFVPNILIPECLDAIYSQVVKESARLLDAGLADGLFFDTVMGRATWLGDVDTDRDGVKDRAVDVDDRWHAAQSLLFDRLRARWPRLLILANDADMGHAPHLSGRLFEGGPLLDRVAEGATDAGEVIRTLQGWMAGTVQPGITFAIACHPVGWQAWRVGQGDQVTTRGEQERARRDFRRMRLGLALALMGGSHFAYDLGTVWYGLPWWYAEYDVPLGAPVGPARQETRTAPRLVLEWRAGQAASWCRREPGWRAVERGIEADGADAEAGWRRILSSDPARAPLRPGRAYRLRVSYEISRKITGLIQFQARTTVGGWEHHDKGLTRIYGDAGDRGSIDTTIIPDGFDDYALEWHLNGAGGIRVTSVRIDEVNQTYWIRDFADGAVLANPLPQPVTIDLAAPMTRVRDAAAPAHTLVIDNDEAGFRMRGAWELRESEGRHVGLSWRAAVKPGSRAEWTFTAPADDLWTALACVPGGKTAGPAALYRIECGGRTAAATVDPRRCDGGWVRLGAIRARRGERVRVTLLSTGRGETAADAVCLESGARLNDGATVRRLTLGPLDGIVLRRGAGVR